jgi:hypothetical protein
VPAVPGPFNELSFIDLTTGELIVWDTTHNICVSGTDSEFIFSLQEYFQPILD